MLNPILVIIGINLVLLLIPEAIKDYLALLPGQFFIEQPWGLITSMFVHANFYHLFANMITLFFFGTYLYRLLGTKRFLIIYFLGGILGGIFYIVLAPLTPPLYPAVGASGAIFALGGALSVLRPNLRVFIFPIPAPMPLWIAVIGIFLIFTILPILDVLPYIAWQAHLGGLVFGLGAGYLFKKRGRYYF